MGKFSRTWQIMGVSWRLLKQDKTLILFPLISMLALGLVCASFAIPLYNEGVLHHLGQAQKNYTVNYLPVFLFYFLCYFVLIFFNAGLVACVLKKMAGDKPTIGYGLLCAWQRLPQIGGWALLASTVGFLLRMIEERIGFIGRIVVSVLGMAWTVTAFLVVPVLVAEGKGPVEAYRESVALFKRSWGEQIIGNVSFGLIFSILGVAPVLLVIVLALAINPKVLLVIAPLAVIYLLVLGLVQSTLQTIYQVAIYRYALDGKAPDGFDDQLLSESFRVKTGKI